jgi:hypothetical protein
MIQVRAISLHAKKNIPEELHLHGCRSDIATSRALLDGRKLLACCIGPVHADRLQSGQRSLRFSPVAALGGKPKIVQQNSRIRWLLLQELFQQILRGCLPRRV